MRFTRKNTLGRRLLIQIVLVSSCITLILAAAQLHRDYRLDKMQLEDQLSTIELSSLASISYSMWTVNRDILETQLTGLHRLPEIEYVAILGVDNKPIISYGEELQESFIRHVYPLVYEFNGKVINLGSLHLTATLTGVYNRLYKTAAVILVSQGLKTFLVSLFILFIVHCLVTRRLDLLSGYSNKIQFDESTPLPAEFNVKKSDQDEIAVLAKAMSDTHHRLSESYSELSQSREQFQRIFDGSNDAILVVDCETGAILESNSQTCELFECRPDMLNNETITRFVVGHDVALHRLVSDADKADSGSTTELHVTTATGKDKSVEISTSKIEYFGKKSILAIVRDQTERQHAQAQIQRLAYHDPLTGLPNRLLFSDRLQMSLVVAKRKRFRGAVLFLDLDNFKTVNDSLGHSAGDLLLKLAANRLTATLRESDTVARLGGDEFVILMDGMEADQNTLIEHALLVAEKVRSTFEKPFSIEHQDIHIGTSIGLAVYPDDGNTVDELLRRADAAMYQAKADGRNNIMMFRPEFEKNNVERLTIGNALREAVAREEFVLHFQYQVNLRGEQPTGAEALIRWERPGYGIVPPNEFIPYLEDMALMNDVGKWVLRESCKQWKLASDGNQLPDHFRMAVNVSARQFNDPDFVRSVENIFKNCGISGENIELEITEQALLHDIDDAAEKIVALKDIGISLAIDDFGTGYSSLSYLHRLPVDTVKIDRSFIQLIGEKRREATLVDTIVDMGHRLGLKVVAEGVETDFQKEYLAELGCDTAQGFLFCRPMPWAELARIRERETA